MKESKNLVLLMIKKMFKDVIAKNLIVKKNIVNVLMRI